MRAEPRAADAEDGQVVLRFEDNALLPMLYGAFDRNLARLEQQLDVSISSRGSELRISGPMGRVAAARAALQTLHERLEAGLGVDLAEVDASVRLAERAGAAVGGNAGSARPAPFINTPLRRISPRSPAQVRYVRALHESDLVFGIGPAGTGKTYLAVARAVSMLLAGEVDRILLSRPAVEAGERLGFLPGDMRDKVDPYLRPLYDALYDMMRPDQVRKRLNADEIEIAPLAFMRGRTLANSFVILDEAQNTTHVQMKMFLTRLGENARMVVTGDLTQVDLPSGAVSGLRDAVRTLGGVGGIRVVRFDDGDVVRHGLVRRIVQAYERSDGTDAPGDDETG